MRIWKYELWEYGSMSYESMVVCVYVCMDIL